LPPISVVLSDVDQLPSGAETAAELADLLVQGRHRAPVTSMSGQCDMPVRRTAVTCNNAIQVTIYNCRNSTTMPFRGPAAGLRLTRIFMT
jgi:hypothetical protein